jgi:peptide/nickel transport system permease protein
LIAAAFLTFVVAMAVFAPLLSPHDPNLSNLLSPYLGPDGQHWLGTDATGRDIASRVIYGARTSLLGPAAIVAISLVVGIPLALLAAWRGGAVAFVVARLLDMIFAIPGLLLAILTVSLFGPGLWSAVFALSIGYLPFVGRLVLATAEQERRLPYIQALTIQGQSVFRITTRHMLRNLAPVLAGHATITFAYALIDLASLSFLGLAVQAPDADWGVLVSDQNAILQGHPMQALVTGLLIVATVSALFVLGARASGERPSLRSWMARGSVSAGGAK